MTRIVGIAGSLRRGSFNRALLVQAQRLMPEGAELEILDIGGIPLYNGDDEERDGVPPAAEVVKRAIASADGLLLAAPEYNGSVSGVMKNVIDWASRPMADQARVLHGKPVALLGASPGGGGTSAAQTAWLPVLRALRMQLWTAGGGMTVASAHQAFDKNGELTDAATRDRLVNYLAGFVGAL